MAEWQRIVFHLDMDAFYAAIEQRDDPSLVGKPVIIGGTGRRGIVSTASYEARKYGVGSAMPGYRAKQLCPHGVFLAPRMSVYAEVSRQLMEILSHYSPDVEPLSLDEAFLEMTGTEALMGRPEVVAKRLQDEVRDVLRLGASIGVAPVKYIAKVASDLQKPKGITVCPPGGEREFLAPLAIERLWGVGKKTAPRFHEVGLRTIGDVAATSVEFLTRRFGASMGPHVWQLANGIDLRVVDSGRKRKSIGAERTLEVDIVGVTAVRTRLLGLVDEVCATLRKKKCRALGVRVKVKFADFTQVTRQRQLLSPISYTENFLEAVDALLPAIDTDTPMRLIGVSAFDLVFDVEPSQMSLLDLAAASPPVVHQKGTAAGDESAHEPLKKGQKLEQALDAVRKKFGDGLIQRASDVERGSRLRTPRPDD